MRLLFLSNGLTLNFSSPALLRNFGVGVKKVYPVWLVKEGDEFTYPKHRGVEVTPPEWEEKGLSQKVIRVVYPVEMDGGKIEYMIAEREGVKGNLLAHVRNNLLNETFGICENKRKATDKQKTEIKAKKDEIISALLGCKTLEEMLACEVARPYMSAAWRETSCFFVSAIIIYSSLSPAATGSSYFFTTATLSAP